MKKLISVLIVCGLLAGTGCSAGGNTTVGSSLSSSTDDTSVTGSSTSVTSVSSSTGSASSVTPEMSEPVSDTTSTTASVTSSDTSSSPVSEPTSEEISDTSSGSASENVSDATSDTTSSETSGTSSGSSDTVSSEPTPAWTEQETSGTMYVNTQGIYSRADAIPGSATVKLYGVNDSVTVVAITDTDYYKLEDGSFIHKDYLSNKKVTVSSSSSSSSSPTPAPASTAEQLLNNAKLKPMKTNEPDVDEPVAKILKKITNNKMTTYQKVKAIYDYIIETSTYQAGYVGSTDVGYVSMFDYFIAVNAYTLLDSGEGVCDNYSSLFVVMTRAIGLESYLMMGQVGTKSGGKTGHVWTLIKLDGKYYTFDPQVEQNNLINGKPQYYFFCRPEADMTYLYTYDNSGWFVQECAAYSGVTLSKKKQRDSFIALFKNFEVDGVRKPFNDYWV